MEIAAIIIYAIGFVIATVFVYISMGDGYSHGIDSFEDFLESIMRLMIAMLSASMWPPLLAILLVLLVLYGLFIAIRYPFQLLFK